MKNTARLLLAGAIAAASFGLTAPPASACDDPRKCAACKTNPLFLINGGDVVTCYS